MVTQFRMFGSRFSKTILKVVGVKRHDTGSSILQ
jgi:hypothetical protein